MNILFQFFIDLLVLLSSYIKAQIIHVIAYIANLGIIRYSQGIASFSHWLPDKNNIKLVESKID